MTEAEAAQDQLRAVADELATIRVVLKGIRSSLPEPPREGDLDDEEEPHDWSAALRSVIDCVLTDSIEPAIRDLQAATSFCGPGREG